MINKTAAVLLLVFFTFLYLVPLLSTPIPIQHEIQQCEQSGNSFIRDSNSKRYAQLPNRGNRPSILLFSIFAEKIFIIHLLSVLAIGLTALLLFSLCFHCHDLRTWPPNLTVIIYLTFFGVAITGTSSVVDTFAGLFLTATLVCFFLATEEQTSSGRQKALLFVSGLFSGCSFLIYGPLAVIGLVMIVSPYLLMQTRWRFIVPELGLGPYLVLKGRMVDFLYLFCLPVFGFFLIAIFQIISPNFQGQSFFSLSDFHDAAQHYSAHIALSPYRFIPAALPVMFMPWILLLPAAFTGWRKRQWRKTARSRLFSFCLSWLFFTTTYFVISSFDNGITSILPCFPPLAVLISLGLEQLQQCGKKGEKGKKYLQRGFETAILLLFTIVLVSTGLYLLWPDWMQYLRQSWRASLSAGSPVALVLIIVALRISRMEWKIILFALSFALFPIIAHLA